MASSGGARVLKMAVLVTSIGALGAGAWYLYGGQIRQLFQKEEASDDTDDDSDDDVEPEVEGGVRSGAGHRPGKRHGKAGRGGKGAAHAHVGGGGGGGGGGAGGGYGPAGKSYEAAIAGNHQQISMGGAGNDVPDLTDAQLSAPLRHVSFLGTCGVPDSTHVTVKVAVRNGRAEGVSVYANPPDPRAAGCVDRSVRGLVWPANPKLDSFVTTY